MGHKNRRLPVRKKPREMVRSMLEDKSPLIMQKVITMGLDGDTQCLKMLVDRILPAHKSVDVRQTKTDYNISINVGALEDLPDEVQDVIDVTEESQALTDMPSTAEVVVERGKDE